MSDLRKAAEMALEALESVYGKGKRCEAAIKALRQALAEPELQQRTGDCLLTGSCAAEGHKIYTAPPKREWVGLTDEERRGIREWQEIQKELGPVWAPMMLYLYVSIEAKLKEKNA